jgi:hypothetical protein
MNLEIGQEYPILTIQTQVCKVISQIRCLSLSNWISIEAEGYGYWVVEWSYDAKTLQTCVWMVNIGYSCPISRFMLSGIKPGYRHF